MEKIFSWKVFVSFCAVFIVIWIALQLVSEMRLENEAAAIGRDLFHWNWIDSDSGLYSDGEITETKIIRKTSNDAIVKVSVKQTLSRGSSPGTLDNASANKETLSCSATLTLYRKSNQWVLGRVEL